MKRKKNCIMNHNLAKTFCVGVDLSYTSFFYTSYCSVLWHVSEFRAFSEIPVVENYHTEV
jgi:hypothetical protein